MNSLSRRDSIFEHPELGGLELQEPSILDERVATELGGESRASLQSTRTALNESALAPVDRGFGAYSFLAGAFIVETIVWGFPSAFGVFLDAYLKDPVLTSQKGASAILPLIGTCSTGIMYCISALASPFAAKYPSMHRLMLWTGGALCFGGLLGASFSRDVRVLLALQGICYAIGGSLVYAVCMTLLPEWFVVKRGLAIGILFAGTAAGGLFLPLALAPLLNDLGPNKTLRILAIAVGVSLVPSLALIRGRLPINRIHGPTSRSSPGLFYLNDSLLWIIMITNTLQSMAYYIPMAWLPTFASALKLSSTKASLTVSLLNGASLFGRIFMGILSDKFDPWVLNASVSILTSFATFIVWGVLSQSFAPLAVYAFLFGAIASSWTVLFFPFIKPICKDDHIATSSVYGYILLSTGIGNILSTPIATSLQKSSHALHASHRLGFDVSDGRYATMIIFTGVCFAIAAASSCAGWWNKNNRA